MYTANIVDAVIFRTMGKHPNPDLGALKNAVTEAETEIWVPASIYRELTNYGRDPPTNPYLDAGIEQGWIRVATPLPGVRSADFDSGENLVVQARHLADDLLNQHTVADIQRTQALGRLAQRYCSKSDFNLKSPTALVED